MWEISHLKSCKVHEALAKTRHQIVAEKSKSCVMEENGIRVQLLPCCRPWNPPNQKTSWWIIPFHFLARTNLRRGCGVGVGHMAHICHIWALYPPRFLRLFNLFSTCHFSKLSSNTPCRSCGVLRLPCDLNRSHSWDVCWVNCWLQCKMSN